jgi:hypothetical protein
MPISELLIPKEVRRTTLRLRINILENLDGVLTNPSLIISLAYFILPTLNPNDLLLATTNVALVIKRLCKRKEKSIPKAPNPIDTKV